MDGASEWIDRLMNVFAPSEDLTDTELLDQTLEIDSNVYKTLLESTWAIPWRIDWVTMRFAYVGPQIERLLGWGKKSWRTVRDWSALIHPDDRERVLKYRVSNFKAGMDHEVDYRAITKDNGFVWIRDVAHVLRNEKGATTAMVGFMFDIGERKKAEQMREDLHRQTLINTRLQERLNFAHDMHDGLGGSLVHMMASVGRGSGSIPRERVLSLLKFIRNDQRESIDAYSSPSVTVPDSPQQWIAPLRYRFTEMFDELDIKSTWQLPPAWHTPPGALQYLALTRLLEEALTNVIRHSRARRVQVRLGQPQTGAWILEVEDDGVGFDVEMVRQADIGIGMRSMSMRIARIGGTLSVASRPGRTVLTVRLKVPA
jgi:PAS domain S-box-containing protein